MQVSSASLACPNCGQRAPIVLRGIEARCTACGAARAPFVTPSVTYAGQPSRVGGLLALVSGWVFLVIGLSLSAFLWLLLQSIWPQSMVGWAFAVPVAVLSLFFGGGLVFGGKRLHKSGESAQKKARVEGIRALVAHRGGMVTASEVAHSLNVSEQESDALLTELAKDPNQNVSLEVDDDGQVRYLFGIAEKRWRVLEEQALRGEEPGVFDSQAEARRDREAKR